MNKIHVVEFTSGTTAKTITGLFQWNFGQILQIKGLDLPSAVEVHFALRRSGEAIRRIGVTKDGVTEVEIPDVLFKTMMTSDYDIYAYVYVSDEEYGSTTHEIIMKVKSRPMPDDIQNDFDEIMKAVKTLADGKVDKNQGIANNGKFLGVVDGYLVLVDAPSGTTDAVRYVEQELTEGQQEQVRANIGAASMTEFSALSEEITESLTEKEASGTADSKVSEHNTSETSHSDIRLLIEGLTTRLNALADSDDTTLDQMSEVVAYIKSNKTLIEAITTNKVSVSDIVDNLTTSASNKPLSAKQGVALKALIDAIVVPKKTSQLTNDSGFLTEHQDISGLAPKATTLSGYGITDGATKEQFNQLSEQIVDYSSHKSNATMHVTSAEKKVWNNKVDASQLPTIVQEAGESETYVMSQKATTDLIKSMIPEEEETEYETVESVEEMTDTSKQYVLKETGTLWAYGEVTENVNVNRNIFDASKVFTGHMSGVNIASSSNKIYPLPVDISQIPEGIDVYVEIEGFYERNTTSPYAEKIGYSALENPVQANNQIIESWYASPSATNTSYLDNSDLFATSKGFKIKVGYERSVKHVSYNTIKTMLLEVVSTQTHDVSTIKAYLQYSYNGTVSKWYDTEITPEVAGGGSGGNYIEVLVKVNKNTSDIQEVSNRVTALETGSETLTIPTFWQDAVNECIAKIKALQVGRNCVTVPFFSDNHQRNGYAGMLIAYIMKECNIPYAFFGGDSISSGVIADEATMIEQDRLFDASMAYIQNGRFCRAVGNHDGYWTDGTNKFNYDRNQIYELFLREESIAQNKHFGDDGTYYYVDDIASKTRFIVMNTNGGSVDATQLSWVQNTALSFNESGWGVVFISHQPISNHYHAGISNAKDVASAISTTATSKNVPIMGWYSGHVHRDILSTKVHTGGNGSNVGTENGDLGFTQVIITSDHTGISYDDATKHTVANDDKSHAIDFATFNKSTRTVNITRLGIGSDRSYTY